MRHGGALALVLGLGALGGSVSGSKGAEIGAVSATVLASPLAASLALSADEVAVGTDVQARATARNDGASALERVLLALRADPAGIVVRGGDARVVRRLRAGKSTRVMWTLCGSLPGNYIVLVRATVRPSLTSESPARLLMITPSLGSSCD